MERDEVCGIDHDEMIANAVLVVAHPDDEALWFGSLLKRVARIVICFEDSPRFPELKRARQSALKDHPYRDKIVWLGCKETDAYNKADWPNPTDDAYGIKIQHNDEVAKEFKFRGDELTELLAPHLADSETVFTHNPWGEYGHEEHILVSNVATRLATRIGSQVWFNNYVSNLSMDLMISYLDAAKQTHFRCEVDVAHVQKIAEVYARHGCWTWLDDYAWFTEEYFMKGPLMRSVSPASGASIPVNLLRLPPRPVRRSVRQAGLSARIRSLFSRYPGRTNRSR